MEIFEELQERGLLAQLTDEKEITCNVTCY